MILHDFCMDFESDRLRSFLSRLGAFASWCWVANGHLVSRGCFRNLWCNISSVQRSVWNFHFLVSRGCFTSLRGLELRTGPWCPEVASETFGVTFSVSRGRFRNLHFEVFRCWTLEHSKRTSGHPKGYTASFVSQRSLRKPNDFAWFLCGLCVWSSSFFLISALCFRFVKLSCGRGLGVQRLL